MVNFSVYTEFCSEKVSNSLSLFSFFIAVYVISSFQSEVLSPSRVMSLIISDFGFSDLLFLLDWPKANNTVS